MLDPSFGDIPGAARFGTVRALQQLHQQFDILSPSVDLGAYSLVVIPETTTIDSSLAARLTAYSGSGSVLFISRGARSGSNGAETLSFAGVRYVVPSPFSNTFTRPGKPLGGLSSFDQFMYDRSLRLKPVGGAEVLALIVALHFESEWDRFSGHNYTPTSHLESEGATIVQNGDTITAAIPRLQVVGNRGDPAYRELIRGCPERLMPRAALWAGAGPGVSNPRSCARRTRWWFTSSASCRPVSLKTTWDTDRRRAGPYQGPVFARGCPGVGPFGQHALVGLARAARRGAQIYLAGRIRACARVRPHRARNACAPLPLSRFRARPTHTS